MRLLTAGMCAVFLALGPVAWGAEAESSAIPGKWHSAARSGVVVVYQDDTRDLVNGVLELAAKKLAEDPGWTDRQNPLAGKRDAVLACVARQLGLEKPTVSMENTWEHMMGAVSDWADLSPNPTRLRLWKRETLARLLAEGKQIPNVSFSPTTGEIAYNTSLRLTSDGKASGPRDRFTPIIIYENSSHPPLVQAAAVIDYCLQAGGNLRSPGPICHEIAEVGMTADLGLKGPFRRWFAEGASNVVAEACVGEVLGKDAADAFRRQTAAPESAKRTVDLLGWRAVEWGSEMPGTSDPAVLSASYGLATAVVRGLVERHGPDTLRKVFLEIAAGKSRDDQVIHDTIRKVTGEDTKALLKEFGVDSPDLFRGVAVRAFAVACCEPDGKGDWRPVPARAEAVELPLRGKFLCIRFEYAVADPPVELKITLAGPSVGGGAGQVVNQVHKLTSTSGSLLAVRFQSASGALQPGTHRVGFYVRDKLLREIEIALK